MVTCKICGKTVDENDASAMQWGIFNRTYDGRYHPVIDSIIVVCQDCFKKGKLVFQFEPDAVDTKGEIT